MLKKVYLQPEVDVVHLTSEEVILKGSLKGVGGTNLGNPSDLSGNDYNNYF